MATQQALILPAQLQPFVITTRPIPAPGPGEVLVRLTAAALNPVEWRMQRAQIPLLSPAPALLGVEGAGEVVALGDGVENIVVGDRVLFQGLPTLDRSTSQQYAIAIADLIAKIPVGMPSAAAATIPVGLATAALGLGLPLPATYTEGLGIGTGGGLPPLWDEHSAGSCKGASLAVLGGASIVGQYVIQIAKYLGCAPIITTAAPKHAAHLKALGATHVVDRHGDIAAGVVAALAGKPLESLFDAVNTPVTQASVDMVGPRGTLVSVWPLPSVGTLDVGERRVAGLYGSVHGAPEVGRKLYARLPELLATGVVKSMKYEIVPGGLAGMVEALGRLEAGTVSGMKLLVDPSATPEVAK